MVSDFRVVESSSLTIGKVYRQLDKVGRGGLRRELRSALAKASKPARMKVRDSERDHLPSGMRQYARVPAQQFKVSGRGVTVRWRQKRGTSDLRALDRGRLRHPVYGNRSVWVNQAIEPGMWSDVTKEEGPLIAEASARILVEYVERNVRG